MANVGKFGPKEGWGVLRSGDRTHHYYDANGNSLCGRVAFYNGPVDPHDGGTVAGRHDCKTCFRKLQQRLHAAKSHA